MIEIDPQDRLRYFAARERPVGKIIAAILLAVAFVSTGTFYWMFVSQNFSGVYKQLNIAPLPLTLELQPEFYRRLNLLRREPCDREAILPLAKLITEAAYPRDGAKSQISFGEKCGFSTELLEPAYDAFIRLGDFKSAVSVASELIKLGPAIPDYRFWRGEAYEGLRDYKGALSDYISTLQLFKRFSKVSLSQFYAISRMYAKVDRPCDAITPLEMYLSYDPTNRQTEQIAKLISDWAMEGNCLASHAAGSDKVLLPPDNVIEVIVNGVRGRMVVDTGASIVSITPSFASRAKIATDEKTMMTANVVGGTIQAAPGYAAVVQVGKTRASDVPVAVSVGRDSAYGRDIDGLLGMTFLARYIFTVSGGTLELKARVLN